MDFGRGTYRIQGLPAGSYMVLLQELNRFATGGSSIGQNTLQLTLPIKEQYYRKPLPTAVVASDFTPVDVKANVVRNNVDLEILGLDNSAPMELEESAAHHTLATAQPLPALPALVHATIGEHDPFQIVGASPIQDLYRFAVSGTPKLVWITLDQIGDAPKGDIDLYLLRQAGAGIQFVRFGLTPTAHEFIGVRLPPGTWYVGVSAFVGDMQYRVRVVPQAP